MKINRYKDKFVVTPTTITDLQILKHMFTVNTQIEVRDYREPDVPHEKKIQKVPIKVRLRVLKTYIKAQTLIIAGMSHMGSRYHHYHVLFGKPIVVLRKLKKVEYQYLSSYCKEHTPLWVLNIMCDKWVLLKLYDYTYELIKEEDIYYGSSVVPTQIYKFSASVYKQISEALQVLDVKELLLILDTTFYKIFSPYFNNLKIRLHTHITEVMDFQFVRNQYFYRSATMQKLEQLQAQIKIQKLCTELSTKHLVKTTSINGPYEQYGLVKKAYMIPTIYYEHFEHWQKVAYRIEIVHAAVVKKLNMSNLFYQVYYDHNI